MRLGKVAVAALAAGVLAGCGSTAADTSGKGGGETAEKDQGGKPWVLVEPGKPTAAPGVSPRYAPRSGLPPVSYLPTESAGCTIAWPQEGIVLIPMIVTPVARGFRVEWPASYGTTYRLTAVHQDLVTGAQPEPTWQNVTAGANCTVTATITGLISGDPYIVWLDAPNSPRKLDGTSSLRSGKSGVVKPL
ncbi:hypothetical protein [Paractinoplanes rishiriensis]|uniref:Fibronectin type-III domain-containing protein n=1 Tax=Paractinoplanes rishiriensis TaxID=1050105 RepID=A0A919K3Y9_9ACTN|nr:hypothetical protein [Actinoplanes rishiriensis]GIE98344.1 hypothetical protein Ari01nite_58090 [Actinoplanes rishiriensis]